MHVDELPDEIIECIIRLTLDSYGRTDVKDLQTFASVSRRWKDIVLNCPSLWSYISVAWDRINQTLDLKLKRSRGNLLEVDDSTIRGELLSCHEILGVAMHRLRTLSSMQSQTEALPSLVGLDLTRLERLSLSIPLSHSVVHQQIGPTPQLRSLTLEGVALTPTVGHFGGLQELTLANLPIPSSMIQNLFAIIQNSPLLQSLSIQSVFDTDASPAARLLPNPGGTLELPLLTHLTVRCSDTSLAISLLHSVSAPKLRFLCAEGKDRPPMSVQFFKAVTESNTRQASLITSILENTKPKDAYLEIEYGYHVMLSLPVGAPRYRLKLALLDGGLPEGMDEIAVLINNVWTSSTFAPPSGIIVKLAGIEDSGTKPSGIDFGFLLKLPDVQVIVVACTHGRVALMDFLTSSNSHPSIRHLRRLEFMEYPNRKEDEDFEPLANAFADKRESLRDIVPSLPPLTIRFGAKSILSPKPKPRLEQESDNSNSELI